MDTDSQVEPNSQEAQAHPDTPDTQTSSQTPESGNADQKRLSDKDRYIKQLEEERLVLQAKMGKPAMQEDETLWYTENIGRLKLVKNEYQKQLDELQSLGAKPSLVLRQKALELAERATGVTPSSEATRQASTASAPSVTDRSGDSSEVSLTEHDIALGIKPETKKKYRALVEG